MAFHAASLPLITGVCLSESALGITFFTTDAEDYIKVSTIGEGAGEGAGEAVEIVTERLKQSACLKKAQEGTWGGRKEAWTGIG